MENRKRVSSQFHEDFDINNSRKKHNTRYRQKKMDPHGIGFQTYIEDPSLKSLDTRTLQNIVDFLPSIKDKTNVRHVTDTLSYKPIIPSYHPDIHPASIITRRNTENFEDVHPASLSSKVPITMKNNLTIDVSKKHKSHIHWNSEYSVENCMSVKEFQHPDGSPIEGIVIIKFADEFDVSIDNVKFPSTTKYIKFGEFFNQSLSSVVFPEKLEILKFGFLFDQPIDKGSFKIPRGLKTLSFSGNFNQSFDDTEFPLHVNNEKITIEELSVRMKERSIMKDDTIECLESLSISGSFNRSLINTKLPPFLKDLFIRCKHIQPFVRNTEIPTLFSFPNNENPNNFQKNTIRENRFRERGEFHDVSSNVYIKTEMVRLPHALESLKLIDNFNNVFVEGLILPQTLKTISVSGSLVNVKLPNSITRLYSSGRICNDNYDVIKLPTNIKTILLKNTQNKQNDSDIDCFSKIIFPPSLEIFNLSGYNRIDTFQFYNSNIKGLELDKFEGSFFDVSFPRFLTELYISGNYDKPFSRIFNDQETDHELLTAEIFLNRHTGNIVKFPDSLELLSIDGKFNQQLIGLETTNIETLEISGDFNNSIDYLPRKLKSLVIRGHDFSFPVVNSRRPLLPETIETIYIDIPDYKIESTNSKIYIPPSLHTFMINDRKINVNDERWKRENPSFWYDHYNFKNIDEICQQYSYKNELNKRILFKLISNYYKPQKLMSKNEYENSFNINFWENLGSRSHLFAIIHSNRRSIREPEKEIISQSSKYEGDDEVDILLNFVLKTPNLLLNNFGQDNDKKLVENVLVNGHKILFDDSFIEYNTKFFEIIDVFRGGKFTKTNDDLLKSLALTMLINYFSYDVSFWDENQLCRTILLIITTFFLLIWNDVYSVDILSKKGLKIVNDLMVNKRVIKLRNDNRENQDEMSVEDFDENIEDQSNEEHSQQEDQSDDDMQGSESDEEMDG